MRARRDGRQRGFTMFELAVAMTLGAIGFATVSAMHASTNKMVQTSRAHLRASAEHRKNLMRIAYVMRAADMTTLKGFLDDGTNPTPKFLQVVGYENSKRIFAGEVVLAWRATGEDVDGIDVPGELHYTAPGEDYVIAENVPQGGFYVTQAGRNLVIHLSTYYVTSSRALAVITSETSISIRN